MARPDRATFRLPAWALFLPIMLLFLITPLATVAAGWGVLFVVPAVALVWVVVTRTTATDTRLTTYGLLGRRRMDWTDLDRLEVRSSRWVVAVGNDDRHLRLPMVRPHDLRRLIEVSGGSLQVGDPAPEPVGEPAAERAVEPAAERAGEPAAERAGEPAAAPGAKPDQAAHPQPGTVGGSEPSNSPGGAPTSGVRVAEQA